MAAHMPQYGAYGSSEAQWPQQQHQQQQHLQQQQLQQQHLQQQHLQQQHLQQQHQQQQYQQQQYHHQPQQMYGMPANSPNSDKNARQAWCLVMDAGAPGRLRGCHGPAAQHRLGRLPAPSRGAQKKQSGQGACKVATTKKVA